MGMLAEAKKKAQKSESDKEHLKPDPKHKKKHAKPSPEVASNRPGAPSGATEPGSSGPDAEPESDAGGADESAAGDESAPESPQGEGADDASGQGGGEAAQPQGQQDQGGAAPDDQGDQGNTPSPDADQDQSQEGGAGGSDDQGEAPSPGGGDSDDSAQGAPGQEQVPLDKVPLSPALKEEFMRCNAALHTALYTNDQVAQHVINGIVPSGPHKVESVARMAVLLVVQINKQLQFVKQMPAVVMPFTQDVVEHVLDLAVQVKKVQFTQQEAHAALGTAQELILRTVGVTKKQMAGLQHALPRSQIMDGLAKYKQHLQFIKGVQGPNSPDQGAAGGGSPGASPPQGGSPGGAPAGGPSPAGQPQPGAPVTAAPGPGQSAPPGGMLSAAQPPAGGA